MASPRILIIGGGAGGLELASRLGNKLGRKDRAHITLIDRNSTHIWKPLLHEVATGTLDVDIDQVMYRAHASNHHFEFQLGTLIGLDRETREVILAPLIDEAGEEVLSERRIGYDYLVLAIGSISNHFNTPGIQENCIFLDSPEQAKRFHRRLLEAYIKLNSSKHPNENLNIAIVGAGATGVELSAELHHAAHEFNQYGFTEMHRDRLKITVVEAGPRILPALPERIAAAAHRELTKLGVDVRVATKVTSATEHGLVLGDEQLPADLMVWAAGIKAPDFLKDLAGLENNRLNQLLVLPTLQTTRDSQIYVIGDCAGCPLPDNKWVPPRAQSAHQMAEHVAKNLLAVLEGKPQSAYLYRDHGSLISLSRFGTVGSLMGNLVGGSMMIEGRIARMAYISLYRMHQVTLHGWLRTIMISVIGRINKIIRPRLKLH